MNFPNLFHLVATLADRITIMATKLIQTARLTSGPRYSASIVGILGKAELDLVRLLGWERNVRRILQQKV